MATIDERVVKMRFDNKQFESGVKETMSLLDRFKKAFNFDKSKDSISSVSSAIGKVSFEPLRIGIETSQQGFGAMQSIALGALTSIGAQAVQTGKQLINSLSMEQINAGFQEYELKMGSIQTIFANTRAHGTSMDEIYKNLDELNTYADKTIYNFGDMTRNIGLFTNAGLEMEESTQMIKGFSNAAAASGTNASAAANAAYQLSQGLSAGYLTAMDWMSLTNAGMGNKNMQRDLIAIADAMGTFSNGSKTAEDATNDFKGSLAEGQWLTKEVMSAYLRTMSGDMDDAALAAMGLSEEVRKSMLENAKNGEEAATKVRTFTQLMDTLKEGVGSGWAQTWELIFGDFEEATELWTKVNDRLEPMLANIGEARNELLKAWRDSGGIQKAFDALGNTFNFVASVVNVVKEAFRNVFPPVTVDTLNAISDSMLAFSQKLVLSDEASDKLRRTFEGLFTVGRLVGDVLGAVASAAFDFFKTISSGSGNILDITAAIGDWIVNLREAIHESGLLKDISSIVGSTLSIVWKVVTDLARGFISLFDGVSLNTGGFTGLVHAFAEWLEHVAEAIQNSNLLTGAFEILGGVVGGLGSIFGSALGGVVSLSSALSEFSGNIFGYIGSAFSSLFDAAQGVFNLLFKGDYTGGIFGLEEDSWIVGVLLSINDALNTLWNSITNANWGEILAGGGVAIFGAAIWKLKNTIVDFVETIKEDGLKLGFLDSITGTFDSVKGMFDQLTGTLETMQQNLQADTLLKIAGAVGILAASVTVLSGIPADDLMKASAAIGVLAAELVAAMAMLSKIQFTGFAKLPALSAAMVALSSSVLILASAVKKLADLDLASMAKGLAGVAASVGILVAAVNALPNEGKLISSAAAMNLMATAMLIMGEAVEKFGNMDLGDMAQGLAGIAGALGILVAAMTAMPTEKMISTSVALNLVGTALNIVGSAVEKFGEMALDDMIQGLFGIGTALALLAATMTAMPTEKMISTSVALNLVGSALNLVAEAVRKFGEQSLGDMVQGLAGIAGSMGILAGSLRMMPANLPVMGAGLIAVGGALNIIASAISKIGSLSLGDLAKGLAGIAGSLGILAVGLNAMNGALSGAAALTVAAGALAMLAPVLLTLGNMDLAEIGKALVAVAGAFGIIGGAAALLTPVIPAMMGLGAALGLIGLSVTAAGAGMLALASAMGMLAGPAGAAIVVLEQLLGLIPKMLTELAKGLTALVVQLGESAKEIVGAIAKLATEILTQVSAVIVKTMPSIVEAFGAIIGGIMQAIIENAPQIFEAFSTLLSGVVGIIVEHAPEIIQGFLTIFSEILAALFEFIPQVVGGFVGMLADTLQAIADHLPAFIQAAADIIVNFLNGIADNLPRVIEAGVNIVLSLIEGVTREIPRFVEQAATMIIEFIHKLADVIREKGPEIGDAAADLGLAIIEGITGALWSGVKRVGEAAVDMAKSALDGAKDFLGIHSPSREFWKIGDFVVQGFANGIRENAGQAVKTMQNVAERVRDAGEDFAVPFTKGVGNIFGLVGAGIDNIARKSKKKADRIARDQAKIAGHMGDIIETSWRDEPEGIFSFSADEWKMMYEGVGNLGDAFAALNKNAEDGSPYAYSYSDAERAGRNQYAAYNEGASEGFTSYQRSEQVRQNSIVRNVFDFFGNVDRKARAFGSRVGDTVGEIQNILFFGKYGETDNPFNIFGLRDESSPFVDFLFNIRETAVKTSTDVKNSFASFGKTISTSINRGISGGWGGIIANFGAGTNRFISSVKDKLKIRSVSNNIRPVSTTFMEFGRNISEGIGRGVERSGGFVIQKTHGILKNVEKQAKKVKKVLYTGDFTFRNAIFGMKPDKRLLDFLKNLQGDGLAVKNVFDNVSNAGTKMREAFQGNDLGFGSLASLFGGGPAESIENLASFFGTKMREMQENAFNFFGNVRGAGDELFNAFMGRGNSYEKLSALVGENMARTITGFVTRAGNDVRNLQQNIFNIGRDIQKKALGVFNNINNRFRGAINGAKDFARTVNDRARSIFDDVQGNFNRVVSRANEHFRNFVGDIQNRINSVNGMAQTIGREINKRFQNLVGDLNTRAREFVSNVQGMGQGINSRLQDLVKEFQSRLGGFNSFAQGIGRDIQNRFQSIVGDFHTRASGFNSFLQGIGHDIRTRSNELFGLFTSHFGNLNDIGRRISEEMQDRAKNVFGLFRDQIGSFNEAAKRVGIDISNRANNLQKFFGQRASDLSGMAQSMFSNLVSRGNEAFQNITGRASNFNEFFRNLSKDISDRSAGLFISLTNRLNNINITSNNVVSDILSKARSMFDNITARAGEYNIFNTNMFNGLRDKAKNLFDFYVSKNASIDSLSRALFGDISIRGRDLFNDFSNKLSSFSIKNSDFNTVLMQKAKETFNGLEARLSTYAWNWNWNHTDMRDKFNSAFNSMQSKFQEVMTSLSISNNNTFRGMVSTISNGVDEAVNKFWSMNGSLRDVGNEIRTRVNNTFGSIGSHLTNTYNLSDSLSKFTRDNIWAMGENLKNQYSGIKDVALSVVNTINANISTNPVIRPVIDLDQFQSDINRMNNMMPKQWGEMATQAANTARVHVNNIQSNVNNNAEELRRAVSNGVNEGMKQYQGTVRVVEDSYKRNVKPTVNYIQNNYSPKPINVEETYRNTARQVQQTTDRWAQDWNRTVQSASNTINEWGRMAQDAFSNFRLPW